MNVHLVFRTLLNDIIAIGFMNYCSSKGVFFYEWFIRAVISGVNN